LEQRQSSQCDQLNEDQSDQTNESGKNLSQNKELKEGIDINKSLLVLGNVISALEDPKNQENRLFLIVN